MALSNEHFLLQFANTVGTEKVLWVRVHSFTLGHNLFTNSSPLICRGPWVRATLFTELKTLFWKVEGAGFETGFSVPKARALPTHQCYADKNIAFFDTILLDL